MKSQTQEIQKITAHIPKDLLQAALNVTHKGITETIKVGLEQIAREKIYDNFRRHRGRVKFSINLNQLRKDK
jgi:hypothetical protein